MQQETTTVRHSRIGASYRALWHVLAYASQRRHTPADVVHDALTGGVVCCYAPPSCELPWHALMPSSMCIATVTPLIAEGYFVPSPPTSLASSARHYTLVCDGDVRDVVTLVVLLFPDCFVEGGDAVTRRGGGAQHTRSESAGSAVAGDDDAARAGHVHVDEATAHVASASRASSVTSVRTPTRGESATAVLPTCACACSSSSSTTDSNGSASTLRSCADIVKVHESRVHVAVLLLSVVNRTVRDVQTRLQLQLTRAAGKPEAVALRYADTHLQRIRMMIMCCIYASEAAYRPAQRWHAHSQLPLVACGAHEHDTAAHAASPHAHLTAVAGHALLMAAEEWECDAEAVRDKWYDAQLERLRASYSRLAGARHGSFDVLLQAVTAAALRDARDASCPLTLLLTSASSARLACVYDAAAVCMHSSSNIVLPMMPVQVGEVHTLSSFTHALPHGLLFDSAPSPLLSFLSQCAQCKVVSDACWRDARDAGLLDTPWAELHHTKRSVIAAFLASRDNVNALLDKQPATLARLVAWRCNAAATTTPPLDERSVCVMSDTDAAAHCDDFARGVVHVALYCTPFSAAVAQFVRELAVQGALSRELFCHWLAHCCQAGYCAGTSLSGKVFVALVQFVLLRCRWQLDAALQEQLSALQLAVGH